MVTFMSKAKASVLERKRARIGIAFILPAVILFIIFTLLPLFMSFYISLTNYNLVNQIHFTGFENYKLVLKDQYFLKSILNVFLYALMYVPIVIISSFVVACLLNTKIPGAKVFRTIYFLPAITSSVASSFIWSWLMNPAYGLLNQMLSPLGIGKCMWLSDRHTALFSIVLITAWGALGSNMLIYLASLQGVPTYLYEAAVLDGCNPLQKVWYITVPMVRPTTYFIFTMTLIGSFQLFDQVYVLTNGGPQGSTATPVFEIYINAFGQFRGGYGAAMSVFLFLVIMAVTFITQRFVKETY